LNVLFDPMVLLQASAFQHQRSFLASLTCAPCLVRVKLGLRSLQFSQVVLQGLHFLGLSLQPLLHDLLRLSRVHDLPLRVPRLLCQLNHLGLDLLHLVLEVLDALSVGLHLAQTRAQRLLLVMIDLRDGTLLGRADETVLLELPHVLYPLVDVVLHLKELPQVVLDAQVVLHQSPRISLASPPCTNTRRTHHFLQLLPEVLGLLLLLPHLHHHHNKPPSALTPASASRTHSRTILFSATRPFFFL